jgi:hypothetical protein
LAVTFAIPLRLILTMTRAELLQFTVEVVLHRRLGHTCNNNDPAVLGDFNPSNIHTSGDRGPNGSGHVLLPECGGRAGHGSYRELCLSTVMRRSFPHATHPGRARRANSSIFGSSGYICSISA